MLPTKQQACSHGNVLSKEHREGSTVTRSGGAMLLLPPTQHGCGAGAPVGHCTAGGGRQRFHMDIFFHWLQFGAAKSQNKNGNIPFCWQKFKAGLGFFLWFQLFPFFCSCLWLRTEIPCHEIMTKPQTKTQLRQKPSPNSPWIPCGAGPRAGDHPPHSPGTRDQAQTPLPAPALCEVRGCRALETPPET